MLQLLGSLHIQCSWTWRDCLDYQHWGGANFLNGSALLSVHSPPVTGTHDWSCSRHPRESCNILHSCFEMALWTLLRKLSGCLLGQHCHSEAWLDLATEFETSQVFGWGTGSLSQQHSKPVGLMYAWLYLLVPLGKKHRHKVMVHLLSKENNFISRSVVISPAIHSHLRTAKNREQSFPPICITHCLFCEAVDPGK